MNGFYYSNKNEKVHMVEQGGGRLQLLAKVADIEVLKQIINPGVDVYLFPIEKLDYFEFFYILEGSIHLPELNIDLGVGDHFYVNELEDNVHFVTQEKTVLMYINNGNFYMMVDDQARKLNSVLKKIQEKDEYTYNHCKRVMNMSLMVGHRLGINKDNVAKLAYAGLYHDVGKIEIPDHILLKPSRLTDEEYEEIKKHPIIGSEMSKEIDFLEIHQMIAQHHERIDGTGYPKGLKGDEICLEAKIIAVVDSFDAMTTNRSYRKGRTQEEAVEEIQRCSGTFYDERVVEVFLKLVEEGAIIAEDIDPDNRYSL